MTRRQYRVLCPSKDYFFGLLIEVPPDIYFPVFFHNSSIEYINKKICLFSYLAGFCLFTLHRTKLKAGNARNKASSTRYLLHLEFYFSSTKGQKNLLRSFHDSPHWVRWIIPLVDMCAHCTYTRRVAWCLLRRHCDWACQYKYIDTSTLLSLGAVSVSE